MGDYNADSDPDLGKISFVAYNYGFFTRTNTKVDQFSTGTSNKVYHMAKKIESNRLQLLVDPDLIPA